MIPNLKLLASDQDPQPNPSNTFILNFTCPHSGKDINGFDQVGFDPLPARGLPTGLMKARMDAIGITPAVVVCNGDWSSLQGNEGAQAKADEVLDIKNDIENGGYNGKMVSITGNHIAEEGVLDHYKESVHDTLDFVSFPYTIVSDPLADYEWERFYFIIGNTIHICMSDRNDVEFPAGKLNSTATEGGHPSGALTVETLRWLVDVLVKFQNYNSFLYLHEGIAETTIGTGYDDGDVFHNTFPDENKGGIMYRFIDLYDTSFYVQDSGNNWFFNALDQWPRFFDFVSQGHTHTAMESVYNGRDLFADYNGTFFFNCGNAGKNHGFNYTPEQYPQCTPIELEEGSRTVKFHRVSIDGEPSENGNTAVAAGLYRKNRRHRLLKDKYTASPAAKTAISPEDPTGFSAVTNGSDTDLSWDAITSSDTAVMILHNPIEQPWAPANGSAGYPIGFNVLNESRVVYFGKGSTSFTDLGTTGGNYRIFTVNGSDGSAIWNESEEIEIWSLPFQSNTVGVNETGGNTSDNSTKVFQISSGLNKGYGTSNDGEIISAQHPLQHNWTHPCDRLGFGIAFAKRRLVLNPSIDRIVLVPAAEGGSGFIDDRWKVGDDLFIQHQAKIDLAITKTGGEYKGGIGIIGERDSTAGGEGTFLQNLTDYHAAQRAKYGTSIIGHHGTIADTYIDTQAKQDIQDILLAAAPTGMTVTDTSAEATEETCGNTNLVHYTGAAQENIGVAFADDIQLLL